MKRALLVLLLLPPFDLDVGIPPGTPMEWIREFRQPVPTGNRGNVPTVDKKPQAGSTVVERPRANDDYIVASLYSYFRVTTVDIMSHISVSLPNAKGKVSQDDVATGGGFVMTWNYPPEMPTELYWMAAMSCLRYDLHPNVVTWPESAAYCLELGEPSYHAAGSGMGGKMAQYLRKKVTDLPKQMPTVPAMKSPSESVMARIAAVELSGGFPHALDPTFARRTLALGEKAYFAVLECAKSQHTFLARNAVVVLANFVRPEATDELVKLFKTTADPVVKIRALRGIVRRGAGKSILPELLKMAQDGKDEPMQAAAIHALGVIGDPSAAPVLRELAKRAEDELLYTLVPALGRLRDGSKETKDLLVALEKKTSNEINGVDTIKPGSESSKELTRLVHQFIVLALAMGGDARHLADAERRALDFHPAAHFLMVEAVGADVLKKKVIESALAEEIVRLEALRRLAALKKADAAYLRELAAGTKGASTRGLALQLLVEADPKVAKEACAKIVGDYASGQGETKPEDAFVVAVAAQIGGKLEAFKAAELLKALSRAVAAKAYARREGKNEVDITKAEIRLHPALVETLFVELGRTADAAAAPALIAHLTKPPFPQGRAEAAIALGAVGTKDGIATLVRCLDDDPDGWVRMCAYRSLKVLSKEDHFCDWIFGDKPHRKKSVDAYKAWAAKTPR